MKFGKKNSVLGEEDQQSILRKLSNFMFGIMFADQKLVLIRSQLPGRVILSRLGNILQKTTPEGVR